MTHDEIDEEMRHRLAEALVACRRKYGYSVPSEVDALLPVIQAIVSTELRAAYWATVAIPDPEAVRDVVASRADAWNLR